MKKLNLKANRDFSIESQSRRYVLIGRKHGDTAYVRLKDRLEGLIYDTDDISWDDILLLVRGRISWKKFLDVILSI